MQEVVSTTKLVSGGFLFMDYLSLATSDHGTSENRY